MSPRPSVLVSPSALLTSLDHVRLLHPSSDELPDIAGDVIVAAQVQGRFHEWPVRPDDLPSVLASLPFDQDIYLTQNRFYGRRRIVNCAQLNACYADIDSYRPHPSLPPEIVLERCLERLRDARMPSPSYAVFTGRGLSVVWLHRPVPRAALPRWNACQRRIWAVLKDEGADRMALDAARVLRLVGTRNSKSNALVRALPLPGPPHRWDFDHLADELLPLTRAEWRALQRTARSRRRPSSVADELRISTLWARRFDDLQRLLEMRHGGQLPPGQRDHWMFLAACAMSWFVPDEFLERELLDLAASVANWGEQEAWNRLCAVITRAHDSASGRRLDWGGVPHDPRYRFTTAAIIESLGITDDEQEQMQVLRSPAIRQARRRAAATARRRAQGVLPRVVYRAEVIARAECRRMAARACA